MPIIETISSTYVRHNWKDVVEGLAKGKTYQVENYGRMEAVVSAPAAKHEGEDVAGHFDRIMRKAPVPLVRVEIQRGGEV